MTATLTAIKNKVNSIGDKKVTTYFFSKHYHNSCDSHPDLGEHQLIAGELTKAIKKIMNW